MQIPCACASVYVCLYTIYPTELPSIMTIYHSRPDDIHMWAHLHVVRMVMQIATLLLLVVSTIDILFMAGVYAAWSFVHECTVAWLYAGREDVN